MTNISLIDKVATNEKVVALTFDDGPNPVYTPQVLEIFQKVGGLATFFMIGEEMKKHPKIAQAVVEENHEIGNHTYTHPMLTELSEDECFQELEQTEKLIEEMTGTKPTIMRPPYFEYNEQTQAVVDRFGYHVISALNGDAKDWEQPGVDHIVTKTRKHIDNGSILIFHDGYGHRSQTIEAVRILVDELTEQGYKLVTVSQLLALEQN